MTDLSVDTDCPECGILIDVKLTELRPGGSKRAAYGKHSHPKKV